MLRHRKTGDAVRTFAQNGVSKEAFFELQGKYYHVLVRNLAAFRLYQSTEGQAMGDYDLK